MMNKNTRSLCAYVVAAGLSLGAVFTGVADAAVGSEFERRLAMIEALETTKNDEALGRLVEEDRDEEDLASYYVILRHHAIALHYDIVEKLLNLPQLDKNSEVYKNAVADALSYYASNHDDLDQPMLEILISPLEGDQQIKDEILAFIFHGVAIRAGADSPRAGAEFMLSHGADPENAFALELDILKESDICLPAGPFSCDIPKMQDFKNGL